MSPVSMTATVEQAAAERTQSKGRLADLARPALGLLQPVLLAVGVFSPVSRGVRGAVASADRKIVGGGRVFRLSGPAMVRRILLPAVMPAYVISLRAGLGLGWMFVVAAEFLGASTGLGFLLIDGPQLGKPAQIVAAIVAFALLGQTTDWLIVLVPSPFLPREHRFPPPLRDPRRW